MGLARQFLFHGHRVTINGTSQSSVDRALKKLSLPDNGHRLQGYPGNVANFNEVEQLGKQAISGFGQIDIWINNAGVDQPRKHFWELDPTEYEHILDINLRGMMYSFQVAFKLLSDAGGTIYNMAGFGSDGRMRPTMSIYGLSKRGLYYFTRSMMKEVKGTAVKVGLLSPGMVMTDLIYRSIDSSPGQDKEAKMIFNILADTPETVTPWLAKKVLANQKNGTVINWLTNGKIMWRFATSWARKRNFWKEENSQEK